MKPIGIRQTSVATALVLAATCMACNRHSEGSASAAAKNAKPGPEESFRIIMETFNRRVAETPIGFVVSAGSSRSSMIGNNEVSSELIAPKSAGEPYRAMITVASKSNYSLRRSNETSRDSEQNKDSQTQSDNFLTEKDNTSGVEILDPSLISTPAGDGKEARPATPGSEQFIARRPDQEVRNYELRYENGRWNLVTKLNEETERAIQNAFDQALGTQY